MELTSTVTAGLTQEGYRYRRILPGSRARKVSAETYEVDFNSPESLQELRQLLVGASGDTIGAVINFLGISQPYSATGCTSGEAALQLTLGSFQFLKEFANDLTAAAQQGGGTVMNLTALDGHLGLGRGGRMALTSSGLSGLFKTFQQEYPTLRVKTVDLDLAAGNAIMGSRLLDELMVDDHLVEVGLSATGRSTVRLELSTAHPTQLGPLPLDKSSVVLITGGANGITYDAALRLAQLAKPTLILVGRSPLPEQEGDDTRDLDTAKLRMHLIQQRKAQGQPMIPAQIEQNLRRILKDRQILDNLAALESTGATVEYHSMDVRDEETFGALIDDLYARFGRIDGVIHGAGVIEDKLMKDKTPQSYSNVFSTKVDSALVLAKRLKPADLKFLVFFSSVSGRFGNGGQADYSAANEFLNKLADDLDRKWPGRVVAINWGAWDAGMVSDELRKLYAARDLYMIPIPDGVQFLENELRLGSRGEPEVTIACSIPKLIEMVSARR